MKPTLFDNSYRRLSADFHQCIHPTPTANPQLIRFNQQLAEDLGLNNTEMGSSESVAIFGGNRVPEGAEPLATAYAGHQFGSFNPQLGDGRAILLGEVLNPAGVRFDLQLKGSGRTAYSRGGDGRSALGPVMREYLVSEAMAKLGVPTTRALAAVTTGEEVARERLVPGGVLTRVATSFVRVGSFEFFANQGNLAAIQTLADHVIARNYPDLVGSDQAYADLLAAVIDRQAALIAQWMHLGFIHGVMNTDNMSIAGETIDYGPCAFMDAYQHDQVFSSIDRNGRYAYNNQAAIGLWNLTRFAETLVPLLASDTDTAIEIATERLSNYEALYDSYWLNGMRAKLGLYSEAAEDSIDQGLVISLLDVMADNRADFTLTFHALSHMQAEFKVDAPTPNRQDPDQIIRALFTKPESFDQWAFRWRERLSQETLSDAQRQTRMQQVNPVIIPRNHRIEAAIRAAEDHGDFSPFHALHEVLQTPFSEQQDNVDYRQPPASSEVVHQTFCGT